MFIEQLASKTMRMSYIYFSSAAWPSSGELGLISCSGGPRFESRSQHRIVICHGSTNSSKFTLSRFTNILTVAKHDECGY